MVAPLSQGLGSSPCGVGPAGHGPADEPTERVVQEPVAALYFDPLARDYKQNSDLTMAIGSGPIQRAAMLIMPLGAIPAVASSGLNVKRIMRALPSQRVRVITDELALTWKPLLDAGLLAFDQVEPEATPRGRQWSGVFSVRVVDLATKKDATLQGKART